MKHLFLLGAVALLCSANDQSEAADRAPNVVLILADDLGYGDLGCYNPDSKIPTPEIDSIAAAGMRFTDAHAAGPLCHPSRYGLMTGQYPFRIDVSRWPTQPLIGEGRMTVASLLRDRGYRTAMVGKWHLGFEERGYDKELRGGPVDRGFNSFFGMRASTDIPPYFYIRDRRAVAEPTDRIEANASDGWSPIQGAFWREGGIAPGLELEDVLPRFTEEAVSVIETSAKDSRPFFLYLAYTGPHTPWLPAETHRGKSGAGMYGDFTMMIDAEVGKVMAALERVGEVKNTMVILASDNGPVWYAKDVDRFGHDSAGGLRGMKGDAWEAGHRMPFLVRWPGRVKPGSVSGQTIGFTDLLATFAELHGVSLGKGDGPDSFSFLPVLDGRQPEKERVRPPLVMQTGSGVMMIRDGDWKYIDHPGSGGFSKSPKPAKGDPRSQLYNLRQDPSESRNLSEKEPDKAEELKHELSRIVKGSRTRPE